MTLELNSVVHPSVYSQAPAMIVYVLRRRPNFLRQLRYLPYTPFQGYYCYCYWINITELKPEMGDS